MKKIKNNMEHKHILGIALIVMLGISGIAGAQTVSNLTSYTADISWTTADAADSTVVYGTNNSQFETETTDPTLTTNHRIQLINLTPNTTYFYQAQSFITANTENRTLTPGSYWNTSEGWSLYLESINTAVTPIESEFSLWNKTGTRFVVGDADDGRMHEGDTWGWDTVTCGHECMDNFSLTVLQIDGNNNNVLVSMPINHTELYWTSPIENFTTPDVVIPLDFVDGNITNLTNNSVTAWWNTTIPADTLVKYGTAPLSASNNTTLAIGDWWNTTDGWELNVAAIDARASPPQVWLILYKDGSKIDDQIIIEGSSLVYDDSYSVKVVDIFTGPSSDMVTLESANYGANYYPYSYYDGNLTTHHVVTISNLTANTTYYGVINSSTSNATFQSYEFNITTLPTTILLPAPVYGVKFTVDTATKNTIPNANAIYTLNLNNTGTTADKYQITAANPQNAQFTLSQTTINLNSNENTNIIFNVTSATAGIYNINLTATSVNDSTKNTTIYTTTTVEPQQQPPQPPQSNNSISGHVINDSNANRVIDTGESGLAGWTVKLVGTDKLETTTDSSGYYEFNNLTAGRYTLIIGHESRSIVMSKPVLRVDLKTDETSENNDFAVSTIDNFIESKKKGR